MMYVLRVFYVCVRMFMNVIRVPMYVVLANPEHM